MTLHRWLALAVSVPRVATSFASSACAAHAVPSRARSSCVPVRALSIRAKLADGREAGADADRGVVVVSERALRFTAMLERCRGYSTTEIGALHDQPRLQRLLVGVVAGARERKVVDAFTVLYEDFLLLRLGGDLIFNVLDDKLRAAVVAQQRRAALGISDEGTRHWTGVRAGAVPGASESELRAAKALFELIDADGSGRLSKDEVRAAANHRSRALREPQPLNSAPLIPSSASRTHRDSRRLRLRPQTASDR